SVGGYIPQCDEDGFYQKFQCWNSVGRCWCSTKEGKRIKNADQPGECE
ncbi:hypothetical protein AVEN_79293-1, partial [Araneus ventricosus]